MATDFDGTLRRVGTTLDVLGEVPIWNAEEGALYWIDVRAPLIRRLVLQTGALREWRMPEAIGSYALQEGGGALVALTSRLCLFDFATQALEDVAAPHAGQPGIRFNDGKCDRQGRFWVGSMHDTDRTPVGSLYRFDARGCVWMAGEVAVPNSLCWSPDGATMYFSDARQPVIWSFPYDPATGSIGPRSEFARLAVGVPDGATVDAEGCVWSTHYGAGLVVRYRPDGAVDRQIALPVTQPTSCAFGGADNDVLLITTASQKLSPEAAARQPLAGALFAIKPGVRGLPEPRFRRSAGMEH